ncbi:MAG TPA: site-specific integrase, partial [Opitutaceae bacterium]|nr:site-specific integrase [Opitutaceae bacterium]
MAHTKSFVISEFTNPSGEVVYRVSGWLEGKRIRKNFSTRAEAKAEADALEIKLVQDETGLRPTVTRLTEDQLHECEAIIQRLAGKSHPLSFYVDFALANYRETVGRKLLSEAVMEYERSKDHEREQDLLSGPHLARIKRDLKRLQKSFPRSVVGDLTAPRLLEYFEANRAGHKTFNNRRGIISTFLKFALQRGWIGENPLIKIPPRRIRRRRGGAVTFSAHQAEQLMAYVEGHHPEAVLYFALCLFAGIRPCLRSGEILRLNEADVKLDSHLIRISAEVSKIREPRNVVIQANLAAWLRAYPLKEFPIIPANLQHIREKV